MTLSLLPLLSLLFLFLLLRRSYEIFFFSRPVVLDSLEGETLKVALLDAQRWVEQERELITDEESRDLVPIVNKATRLKALISKLDLQDVCM